MKNFYLIVAIVAVLALAYVLFTQSSKPETVGVPLLTQNNSGQVGVAVLVGDNKQTKVTLNLAGGPKGITQPAHIHEGSCEKIGAVKYPLTFPVNGMSETFLNVSIAKLRSQRPLALNVHKSTADPGIYVACGNIDF